MQDNTRHDNIIQYKSIQGKPRQYIPRNGKTIRTKTRQDKTTQGNA